MRGRQITPTLTKSSFSTASIIFAPGIVAVILIGSLPMARGRILNVKLLLESAWMGSGPGSRPRSDRSSWRSIERVTWIVRYTPQYIQHIGALDWTNQHKGKCAAALYALSGELVCMSTPTCVSLTLKIVRLLCMRVCRSANVRLGVQVYVNGVVLTHQHIP